ncbi:MAG: choice-of-anchor L domain-containing protein, partial [Candidatus Zixiibacteriota bacterium]
TVVLFTNTIVNPGVNHIKIAIADAGDDMWDSNIFLKAQSFICGSGDIDEDGIDDPDDNCPYTYNPNQEDTDGDGVGDACCCISIRGNVDGSNDNQIDIEDIVYLIDYAFNNPSGPEPPCPNEADINGDGTLDIEDIVYLIDYAFNQPPGPEPTSCYLNK